MSSIPYSSMLRSFSLVCFNDVVVGFFGKNIYIHIHIYDRVINKSENGNQNLDRVEERAKSEKVINFI